MEILLSSGHLSPNRYFMYETDIPQSKRIRSSTAKINVPTTNIWLYITDLNEPFIFDPLNPVPLTFDAEEPGLIELKCSQSEVVGKALIRNIEFRGLSGTLEELFREFAPGSVTSDLIMYTIYAHCVIRTPTLPVISAVNASYWGGTRRIYRAVNTGSPTPKPILSAPQKFNLIKKLLKRF